MIEEGNVDAEVPGCQVSQLFGSFGLLAERYTPDLIHLVLHHESLRSTEIRGEPGISPTTLSQRLKTLTPAGLFSREAHQEIPPRVGDVATTKARDLSSGVDTLAEWAKHQTFELVPG